MARGTRSLARVAVVVRAGAAPLWWLGLLAAGIGALLPGLTGRRIGLLSGAALLLIAAAVTASARWGRCTSLMAAADRAGRHDVLQDRRVTLRVRRRARRWVYPSAFLAAVVSSFALPGAGGLLLAGIGAGLWLKAVRIGRREEDTETLYWVSVDEMSSAGAVGKPVTAFRSTGIGAGDAAPGGARRRR